MTPPISYLSVCSGIEAASEAWEPLGFEPAGFAEIEQFPSAVLAAHWPHVTNYGDMLKLPEMVAAGTAPAPDILVGGTPCQAFSVAGLRGGLSDSRGALTLSFVRLANAIDASRSIRNAPPCVVVWENVPGVLSSKDNAFGHFLAGLAGEDGALLSPGKRWSNAGLVLGPQRAVAWRTLDAQYFGLAQRRRRVFVVASARNGFDPCEVLFECEGVRRDTPPRREAGETTTHDVAPCVDSSGVGFSRVGDIRGQDPVVAVTGPLTARYGSQAMGAPEVDSNLYIPVSVALRGRDGSGTIELSGDVATALWASSGGGDKSHVLAPVTPINTQIGLRGSETSNTTREGLGIGNPSDPAFTLQAAHHHAVQHGMAVRRLTPRECERLQGFNDNHTAITYNKKPAADGPRYKAIGNSMAVTVMHWIGCRLKLQLAKDGG